MPSWTELSPDLSPNLIKTLIKVNYNQPTPIQASSIPYFLRGKDVCVEAATGSGKTLAFLIPLLNYYLNKKKFDHFQVDAVILSPTWELAHQIFSVFDNLYKTICNLAPELTIKYQTLIGGNKSSDSDIKIFIENKGANLIIATPGRLEFLLDNFNSINIISNDSLQQERCKFSQCFQNLNYLILDEGDRFLEMGFLPSLQKILNYFPKQRRTCLYSATLTEKMESIIKVGLRDPISIMAKKRDILNAPRGTENQISNLSAKLIHDLPKSLNCFYKVVDYDSKFNFLLNLLIKFLQLNKHNSNSNDAKFPRLLVKKVLVFVSNYATAQYLSKALKAYFLLKPRPDTLTCGLEISCLHRKMRHAERAKTLQRFKHLQTSHKTTPGGDNKPKPPKSKIKTKNCMLQTLISTDLMCRGIDVEAIDWVIHLDPPSDIQRFIHRSGRTARISNTPFVTPEPGDDIKINSFSPTSGNTLLVLHPGREENFIDFLVINQNVVVNPLNEYFKQILPPIRDDTPQSPIEGNLANLATGGVASSVAVYGPELPLNAPLTPLIQEMARRDRAYMLKGIRAFVSHVRSYTENKFELIFRSRDLQFGKLANGFGLLYLPRMPEIAKSHRFALKESAPAGQMGRETTSNTSIEKVLRFTVPYPDLDVKSIPFEDAAKECERLRDVHKPKKAKKEAATRDGNKIKTKKKQKGKGNEPSETSQKLLTRRQRAKNKQKLDREDVEEFARDAKLLKKFKRQKMSKNEFEEEFYVGLN